MGANDLTIIQELVPEGMTWFRHDGTFPRDMEQLPVPVGLLDADTLYGMVDGIFGPVAVLETSVILPTLPLSEVQAKAVAQINVSAGAKRAEYVTVTPGQEMIYLAKEAEATRYLAESPVTLDGYPLLAAEVGITAPSAHELAQIWLNMSALWRQVAAAIEAIRLSAIQSITAANDPDSIEGHIQTALDALAQL